MEQVKIYQHLIVLVHGMDGFAADLIPVKEVLNKYGVVLIPECNQGRTNGGIQEGGERLYQFITQEIQKYNSKYLSLVCHGLGGLYARYAIKLLHQQNIIPGDVTPLNFITIATHHLGSRYYYNTLGKDLQTFVFGIILGQTGKELLLRDDEENPILLQMAKREYLEALHLFEKRVTYSYCKSNSSSQYRTSSLKRRSTLNLAGQKPIDTSQPHIVVDSEADMVADPEEDNHENEILNALDRLEWKRMAIVSGKSFFSSLDISKSEFWKTKNAFPVIQSIATQFESHVVDLKETEKPASPPTGDVHLVVLIHGLDGFNTDMAFIGARLKSRFPSPLFKILAPECNHGRTYDGILAGATRIYACVQEEIKQTNVKFISIIGHSLGGMYGRCLIGLMYQDGLIPNKIQPINYISLATPHLGSREHGKIFGENVTSAVLGTFIGNTGKELMLADGNELQVPFLLKLVEEPFIKPLTYFVKLIVYSNVRHDASVHYSTAAIRKLGPFRTKVDVSLLSLPAIIPDVAEEEIPVVPPYTANAKLPWEDLMLNTLITLPWKRYAVIPTRPLLAHIDIIIKSEFLNRKHGFPIITHLVDHFRQPIDGPPDNVVEEIPATVQQPKVHLIILIHGIDGVGHDMIFLAEKLRDKFKRPNYKISIPTCNDHKTNDGIVAASTRLLAWILEEVEKSNADKISFICHSIGGLYTRFLLKMLMDEQVIPNKLQPVFFITIDTPHLGFQHSSITNTLLSYKWLKPLISPTGCELNLIDNFMTEDGDTHHILEYLTHPDYMEPLRQFQHLVLYGNMYQEGSLYSTYCIGTLQSIPSTIPTKFHQISTVPLATQPVYNDSTEHKMAKALTQLPWKRFTIVPAKTIIPTPPDQYFIDNSDHPLADHILNYLLNNIDRPRSPIQ